MATERWEIDSGHSGLHFSVLHMVVARVRGEAARWTGTILAEDGDFGRASVDVLIDATSIETGLAERDAHLRSPDFFDARRYPEATFKCKRVERISETRLRVTGDLMIRGITREVALEVEHTGRTKDPWGHERAGFTAKTWIDRTAFGLRWNQALEAGAVVVGDRVDIEIEIEAVKQTAVKAA